MFSVSGDGSGVSIASSPLLWGNLLGSLESAIFSHKTQLYVRTSTYSGTIRYLGGRVKTEITQSKLYPQDNGWFQTNLHKLITVTW